MIAQAIIQAAEAALLAGHIAGGNITRDREAFFEYGSEPAVLLNLASDLPASQPAPIGIEYRLLLLDLEISAEGAVPHDACNAILAQAHPLLRTALALYRPEQRHVEWSYDDENPALGIVRAQYQLIYRRQEGEL